MQLCRDTMHPAALSVTVKQNSLNVVLFAHYTVVSVVDFADKALLVITGREAVWQTMIINKDCIS